MWSFKSSQVVVVVVVVDVDVDVVVWFVVGD